jgi:hypothetical protein
MAWPGIARRGAAGKARQARTGRARQGVVRCGSAGEEWPGMDRRVLVRQSR